MSETRNKIRKDTRWVQSRSSCWHDRCVYVVTVPGAQATPLSTSFGSSCVTQIPNLNFKACRGLSRYGSRAFDCSSWAKQVALEVRKIRDDINASANNRSPCLACWIGFLNICMDLTRFSTPIPANSIFCVRVINYLLAL